ncbi:MAG: sugar ABC transporter permease, partial [Clostridiales bacterium]|nr:sugar ABC transporter permease [Clostridiales bacterium]
VTALMMALLLNVQYIRGKVIFRTAFYLPSVVPAVASGLLWTWIFNPDFGLLNAMLRVVGIGKSMWIYAEATAVPSLVMMSAWGCGGTMVIYLAGLQSVPIELLEAVEIDGGGVLAKFRYCTIPMLSPVLFYNTLMGLIAGFMTFTNTYVMTSGGPNNATLFTSYLIYRNAFQNNEMGYASALAWIVFVVLAAVTVAVFRVSGRLVYYGDAGDGK